MSETKTEQKRRTNVAAVYSGGITGLREIAVRRDGVTFKRYQDRDPRYGYRWGAWKVERGERWGQNMLANPPRMIAQGATSYFLQDGVSRRVPA